MEERSRLGRGLHEISRLYLSDTPREDAEKEEPGSGINDASPEAGSVLSGQAGRGESGPGLSVGPETEFERNCRVIRVIHPGSALMSAFFTANFSLELARHRHRVAIWDGAAQEGEGVEAMFGQIIHQGPADEALSVKLYGLPDIAVYRGAFNGGEKLLELMNAAGSTDEDRWLVIDTPHCLNALMEGPAGFDAILLSTVDRSSLLRCYACVKVIGQRDPRSRVSLVFVEPASDAQAGDAFSRFSAFASERLGACVDYLGHLMRDELMDSSISGRRPLVLGHEPSAARESITAVSRAFLQRRDALSSGQ